MRSVSSIIALAALAGAVAGCAQETYYPRYGYSQATYYPARTTTYYQSYPATAYYSAPATTYYSAPATTYVTTPTYYTAEAPNFQKSNVYSSYSDYLRNYKGIHGGPERTGW